MVQGYSLMIVSIENHVHIRIELGLRRLEVETFAVVGHTKQFRLY